MSVNAKDFVRTFSAKTIEDRKQMAIESVNKVIMGLFKLPNSGELKTTFDNLSKLKEEIKEL